jgi:hypothetical protein
MPKLKNQHYVPEFYLKNFSTDNKNLNVYVIKDQKFTLGPIKHQCSKSYFYSKDTTFETLLSQLESNEASAINKLIREKSLTNLNYEIDFIRILEFISVMHGRTLSRKKGMEKMLDDFTEKIFKPMFRADPLSKGLSDEDIKSIKIKNPYMHLLGVQEGVKGWILLSDLVPILLVNNNEIEFWISDHPIVFYNRAFHHLKGVSMCGYTSFGLQVFCPLSPTLALMLVHSPYYKIKMNKRHKVRLSQDEVKEINKLQFFSGYNSVFYKTKSQEKHIQQTHTELGEIPEKPYVDSKFEKFTSADGTIKDMFHTSNEKNPYELNLKFLKPKKVCAGSIGFVRNRELYELFDKMDSIIMNGKEKNGKEK